MPEVAIEAVAVAVGRVVVLDDDSLMITAQTMSAMSPASPGSDVFTSWRTPYGPA